LMFITANGMLVRISAGDISTIGRNTKGVRVVNVKDGDRLIAAAKVEGMDETPQLESTMAE
ncbi:MAG: DNA gyrase C-terminal beta-propeller domain-containing protein, partial [Planctomycetota bacterium]|nr:DNA gyrase C-terminal beta-propeller domain-containing protein [Planctomycetota bacterium]